MLRNFEDSSTKTVAEESMSPQTPLGSVVQFAGDLNRKFAQARSAFPDPWQIIRGSGT
jgi:hypothetical protein